MLMWTLPSTITSRTNYSHQEEKNKVIIVEMYNCFVNTTATNVTPANAPSEDKIIYLEEGINVLREESLRMSNKNSFHKDIAYVCTPMFFIWPARNLNTVATYASSLIPQLLSPNTIPGVSTHSISSNALFRILHTSSTFLYRLIPDNPDLGRV